MSSGTAIEQAWKIHQAQVDWTGKVDAKASFAFAIESAGIATVVALSAKDRVFSNIPSAIEAGLYWAGLLLLFFGAAFAMWTVVPRLKSGPVKKMARDHFIYFGHAQHWTPRGLANALEKRDILPIITSQITVMAEIAWRKHRWVQLSMWLGGIGGFLLVLCGLILSF